MKNLFKILLLSVVLTSFIKADDLLASLTNGKISDNSNGVKVLSLKEMKQVKGGYIFHRLPNMDSNGLNFWVVSNTFYITKDSSGNIKPNPGTDYIRDKMGIYGQNVVVLGVKNNYATNDKDKHDLWLYDTRNKMFIQKFQHNDFAKKEYSLFKSYAK